LDKNVQDRLHDAVLSHDLVVERIVQAETRPEVLQRNELEVLLGALEELDDPQCQPLRNEEVLRPVRVSPHEKAEHLDQVGDELAVGEGEGGHILPALQGHERPEQLLDRLVVKVLHELVGALRDGRVCPHACHVVAVGARHGIHRLAVSDGVQQHLDGLSHLRLDAEVRLDQ
jgi:hypothetical protein